MIVKFFNRGKGSGSGPVDYLLGKNRDREFATLCQGDTGEIINLINSCKFEQRYKAGCLSFLEEDLPKKTKEGLMDSFEKALMPGLDKNQYSILWVEHRDKGRLELNFVIPCVELTTSKRLQPYYHSIDRKRIDTWKRIINTKFNLHDPDAPENKRSATDLKVTGLPKEKKLQAEHISNALLDYIEMGVIKDRSDIVRIIEESGFTIARKAKKTISIKDPNGGKNIKLRGEIYEESFKFSREHAIRVRKAQNDYDGRKSTEYARNFKDFKRLFKAKSRQNGILYQIDKGEGTKEIQNDRAHLERIRKESPSENQLSDKISDIQIIEIQRGDSLSNAGSHNRTVWNSLGNGERDKAKLSNSSTAERNHRNTRNPDSTKWRNDLSSSSNWSSKQSIQEWRTSNLGVEINDRARESPYASVERIINKSRSHIQRIQKLFGEFSKSLLKVRKREHRYESVSERLSRESKEFNRAVKQIITRIENKRESKLEREQGHDYYGDMQP